MRPVSMIRIEYEQFGAVAKVTGKIGFLAVWFEQDVVKWRLVYSSPF